MSTLKAVGIVLKGDGAGRWMSAVEFSSMEHANNKCIDGEIGPRYWDGNLSAQVDRAKAAAEAIGVTFLEHSTLFMERDGEGLAYKLPENWREMLNKESQRIGWVGFYSADGKRELARMATPAGKAAEETRG